MLLLRMMLRRRHRLSPLKVNVYPSRVLLGLIPQPQLATQVLDLWLELLHVASRMVAFPDDGVQMSLAARLILTYALFENALSLLDELAVQVYGVRLDATRRVVLAEDVIRGLTVVLVHLGVVLLALVGEGLCGGTVSGLVGLSRPVEAQVSLVGFGAGEAA